MNRDWALANLHQRTFAAFSIAFKIVGICSCMLIFIGMVRHSDNSFAVFGRDWAFMSYPITTISRYQT